MENSKAGIIGWLEGLAHRSREATDTTTTSTEDERYYSLPTFLPQLSTHPRRRTGLIYHRDNLRMTSPSPAGNGSPLPRFSPPQKANYVRSLRSNRRRYHPPSFAFIPFIARARKFRALVDGCSKVPNGVYRARTSIIGHREVSLTIDRFERNWIVEKFWWFVWICGCNWGIARHIVILFIRGIWRYRETEKRSRQLIVRKH